MPLKKFKCKHCGSSRLGVVSALDSSEIFYHQCIDCRTVYAETIDIYDEDWPQALPENEISRTEQDKVDRGASIIEYVISESLEGKRFLDFGCGEGHALDYASTKNPKFLLGYDIVHPNRPNITTNFEEVKTNAPYDVILIFDVLDHMKDRQVETLRHLKDVLSPTGRIYIKCHPWSARHGAHVYETNNKAYIQFFDDTIISPSLKLKNPIGTYRKWFKEAYLDILSESPFREELEDYFKETHMWDKLASYWQNDPEFQYKKIYHLAYSFGSNLEKHHANFGNYSSSPVGSFQPNAFGIHDMHGNVWEWCEDWFGAYPNEDQIDPVGPENGEGKCLRGGCYADSVHFVRTAQRGNTTPHVKSGTIGMRVVLDDSSPNNSFGIKFVRVDAGTFMMGSPFDEAFRENLGRDETQHYVTLTKSFYIGIYPITQKQFKDVMGYNPSINKNDRHPVENIDWFEANQFCETLTQKEGKYFRLPTEAEWEYSCRAIAPIPRVEELLEIQTVDYVLTHASGTI